MTTDSPYSTFYPIVLVHGFFGFDTLKLKNLALMAYWNGIDSAMRKKGADVHVVSISAANSTEFRGKQLLEQVRIILMKTGKSKVHLIGHSHGGPTARYAAGKAPELVASVTTVGGVNYGSKVADAMLHLFSKGGDKFQSVGIKAGNIAAKLLTVLNGHPSKTLPQDSLDALISLSTEGSAEFNSHYPFGLQGAGRSSPSPLSSVNKSGIQHPMLFYSWSGEVSHIDVGPTNLIFSALNKIFFHGEPADGLVSVSSAHFGKYLGTYEFDHLGEVNQTSLPFQNPWASTNNAISLFCKHANRLKLAEAELLNISQ